MIPGVMIGQSPEITFLEFRKVPKISKGAWKWFHPVATSRRRTNSCQLNKGTIILQVSQRTRCAPSSTPLGTTWSGNERDCQNTETARTTNSPPSSAASSTSPTTKRISTPISSSSCSRTPTTLCRKRRRDPRQICSTPSSTPRPCPRVP